MNTVGQLREMLSKFDDDMVVMIEADHDQSLMKPTWVGISFVRSVNESATDAIHPDDADDDVIPVVHIQAY
ncbi:MAG: hypothetical protein IBX56_20175 [Methylomicrobium sp.]|nr:hypothetical protein [Methylomicrobium sp.]